MKTGISDASATYADWSADRMAERMKERRSERDAERAERMRNETAKSVAEIKRAIELMRRANIR